jgi:hypothetical protein
MMNAHPGAPVCALDEVPLHAELRWTTQGSLTFDVSSVTRRADLPVAELATPPVTSSFTAAPPPLPPGESLLSRAELTAFRTGPAQDTPVAAAKDAQAPNSEAGLLLVDSTDELRVAWLDGVPVAWVTPGGRALLPSLQRGRYALQWRTFLGDAWEAPEVIVVPGTSEVGAVTASGTRP